ncbi:MAG TPA: ACT domain-containing protein [bacterium]|nr:ACT domain-containing protein [bacterium]
MDSKLKDIITKSTFQIIPGVFVYTKVAEFPKSKGHFLITQDEDEITVVTKESKLDELSVLERNKDDYALIALNVSIPFYCVGFLAAVSRAVADSGANILIVSTYSKDYIMVQTEHKEVAREVLLDLGFKQE